MDYVAEFSLEEECNLDATFEINTYPSKVSQLENDLKFQTEEQVDTTVNKAVDDLTALINEDYAVLDNKIDLNTSLIKDLNTNLSALGDTVEQNYEEINNKIEINISAIKDIDIRLSALGNTVSADFEFLDRKIEANTNLIEGLDTRLSALGNTVSDDYITLDTKITNHIDNKTNPHNVTKSQVGLGNCDNTSDLDKPISTAQQQALDILDGKINANTSVINDINTTLSALGSTVNIEITNRENADINLQQQIDAITSASDVTDIVGTYAQLQDYDTSTLPDQSIIKVLQDETQNDAMTYYRWVIVSNVGSWNKIGQEGPYYTKSQSDLNYVPQTRTINNKQLNSNILIDYNDVGALSSSTTIDDLTTQAQQDALNSTATKNKIDQINTNTSIIQEINTTLSALGQTVSNNYLTLDNLIDINTSAISDINTVLSSLGTAANYDATDFATASQGAKADTALQSITSTDVTNALGYTPYNSSNPNGYISSASLENLTDVTLSNLSNGQNLTYDSTIQKWKNTTTSATIAWGGVTGDIDDQTDLKNALADKQNTDTSVTHTASTAVGSATKGVYIASDGTATEMTYSVEKSVPSNAVFTDTTYTFATGSANGTISVDETDVAVKGLGSAAYTQSSDYATSSQGTKADSAIQTVKVNDTALTPDSSKAVNVSVPTKLSNLTDDTATIPIAKATTSTKLGSSNVGSATNPICLIGGTATACTYNLEKSVPSNAVFTDTTYIIGTGSTNGTISVSVNGGTANDVSVYGLGSAAFTASTAYATSSQGAKADSAIQPNDNITELTNNAGYITGITSSDVTTAIGYTPYNSTNPNGYQANIIETVKVNGTALTPSNKAVDITVPSVGNGTITINQGGTQKGTFTTNQSGNTTINLDSGSGSSTDVQINGTSITSNDVANIVTESAYNSSSNKIATMSDVPTKTSDLTNDAGYITGITSTDVTSALGYTPYNSTNPNGYTTNVGTITGITMNGSSKGTSGVVDLGTVLTEHQDISGKADKATSLSGYGITDAYTKTEIDGKLTAAMHYKGTVANVAALSNITNPSTGDVYNVTDTGANYAYNGTSWDKLSENIDLSGYVPTSRTVNGKALTGDITLSASDVSALPSSTTIPSKTSDLTNDSGFITSISSSDVTTALGYTPYDSSNPNGYTSNVGTVTSVNNVSPVNGNVSITIPTVPTKISDLTDDTATTPVTKATTATKLGSSDVGSATQGIYLDDGEAKACTYTVSKSVPSNAVFTDTNTKVTQNVSSTNSTYPILLCPTANATSNQGEQTSIFCKDVKVNASTGTISAVFSGDLTGNVTGNCSGSSGSCTGNAATATSATSATTASKLGSSDVGSTTKGIYLDDGTPKACTYSVSKDVPSNAVFTDTTYANGSGISIGTGNAINHSNSITAGTAGTSSATSGSTLAVPYVTYDAQGHVTASGTHTHTVTGFLTSISSLDVTTALGYTPVTNARTVNGKALSSNITLTASDVGALSASYNSSTQTLTIG